MKWSLHNLRSILWSFKYLIIIKINPLVGNKIEHVVKLEGNLIHVLTNAQF